MKRHHHHHIALFVALLVCGGCLCRAAAAPPASETIAVLRIPTGSRGEALRVERELDRAGLGLHFDRGRVGHHMEAAIPLPKLLAHTDSPDALFRAAIPDWHIVRNLTRNEPVRSRHASPRAPAASGGYLPIHKNAYHDAQTLEHTLRALTHTYPGRANLRTIGRTARGANVWNLELGTGYHHGNSTPKVLLMGSLHGDDLVGTELCLWLAEYLCQEYDTSTVVRTMMDTMSVQLVPMPNPDASAIGLRYTTKGADLDRGFPDRISRAHDPDFLEKEAQLLMDWVSKHRPIAAGMFLGGGGGPGPAGLVVRYPWNALKHHRAGDKGMPARAPDDRGFRYLARSYAEAHPTLAADDPRPLGVDRGLVNGAAWYSRYGSFQDWFYDAVGAPVLDFVVSPYLKPRVAHLHRYWEDNRQAAIAFLREAGEYGVRGTVVDAATGAPVPHAKVLVRDLNDRSRHLHPILTNADRALGGVGDFARFAVPGRYSVRVEAPGYATTAEHMFRIDDRRPIHTVRITM